jgi:hypothetical protein
VSNHVCGSRRGSDDTGDHSVDVRAWGSTEKTVRQLEIRENIIRAQRALQLRTARRVDETAIDQSNAVYGGINDAKARAACIGNDICINDSRAILAGEFDDHVPAVVDQRETSTIESG